MQREVTNFERTVRREPVVPTLQQLQGQLARLERELALAFSALPWNQPLVQRIVDQISTIESTVSQLSACE